MGSNKVISSFFSVLNVGVVSVCLAKKFVLHLLDNAARFTVTLLLLLRRRCMGRRRVVALAMRSVERIALSAALFVCVCGWDAKLRWEGQSFVSALLEVR